MASFQNSIYTPDRRGKVGGSVFQKGRFGNMERVLVTPRNPKTPYQLDVRSKLTSLSKIWGGMLTAAQRAVWTQRALTYPYVHKGKTITLTGFLMFMRLNRNFQEIGQPILDDCPQNLTSVLVPFDTISVEAKSTPGSEDIKLDFSPAIDADKIVMLYATTIVKSGTKVKESAYRKIGTLDSTFLTGSTIQDLYVAKFNEKLQTGSMAAFKTVEIDKNIGVVVGVKYATAVAAV
jgi:hypothetical protein